MKKNLVKVFCLVLILGFLSACCSNPNRPSWERIQESFVKVSTVVTIQLPYQNQSQFLTREIKSGSGFSVQSSDEGTYVVSAGHVCVIEKELVQLTTPPSPIVAVDLLATDINLNSYTVKVISIDEKRDLCLLFIGNLNLPSVEIASDKSKVGDKVLHVGSPFGILYKGSPLLVLGVYSGYSDDLKMDIYGLNVEFGCSGGAIFNEEGEVVGLVSAKDNRFPSLTYSPPQSQIQKFLMEEKNTLSDNLKSSK